MYTKKLLFSLEVFIVFLSLTLYLWHTIQTTEGQKHHQAIETNASQLKSGIESFVNEKILTLLQVRNFWLNSESVSHDQFIRFCKDTISQIPGFEAIEYGGTANRVVWVEPFVTNGSVEQFNDSSEPIRYEALQIAIRKKTVALTPVLNLVQGGKGFVAIVPIFKSGKYEGSIFGVFRIDTLFSLVFDSVLKQHYYIAVFDGNQLIYGDGPILRPDWMKSPNFVKETVAVRDQNWDLILWPREMHSHFGIFGSSILVLGLALSFVLASLVWVLSSKAEQADLHAALIEVSNHLGAATDIPNILRVTGGACLRMTRVDRCGIFLWNELERQFEPAWVSSNREKEVQRFDSLKLKYGSIPLVTKIVDEKRSVLAHQASKMGLIDPGLARVFNIESLLVVPMVTKGKLVGAMTLDHAGKKHNFSSTEQTRLEGIASQAAIALENARLSCETEKQADLIARKNLELESFLFILSHDLRNPIIALSGMVSLLAENCARQLNESGQHYLDRIQANLAQMENLVKDVFELSTIGRVETRMDQVDVREVLEEVLHSSKGKTNSQHVKIHNHNHLTHIHYNRRGLAHIFSNLIENAINYCAYQEHAQVDLGSEEDVNEYRFYVKDNGIGIDPKFHQSIFSLFHRLQDLKNVEGTGVGLAIVHRVLATYGGKVWLSSERGKGTTFFVAIPKTL